MENILQLCIETVYSCVDVTVSSIRAGVGVPVSQLSVMMNLHLPSGGLGRGRVWRSQAWVGGHQPSKPWLGTLNPGSSASGGMLGGAGCACPWAGGNDLPYIQQSFMSDSEYSYSLGDFFLPSPTSPTAGSPVQRQPSLTSSPAATDDVNDDVTQRRESLEVSRSLYVIYSPLPAQLR